MKEILVSGLYDAATEIRCGILLDSSKNIYDLREIQYILHDSIDYIQNKLELNHRKILGEYVNKHRPNKMKIVYIGNSTEYERPTLLHMKKSAETDPPNTKYFYLHTKGLRWFGTQREDCVVDWIKLLLYWNIENWCDAVDVLNKYDTYGCNFCNRSEYPPHYSGNFFWTTTYHLKTLPDTIGPHYNDPEFWLSSVGRVGGKPNIYNAFSSSYEGLGHYAVRCPESLYRK
jgi:hypothetical protein